MSNAVGARRDYRPNAPTYAGADRPLVRDPETTEPILGPSGMLSRGQHLRNGGTLDFAVDASSALQGWLRSAQPGERREVLAIGPLTNIARLVQEDPDVTKKITRHIWMDGSDGVGNHSEQAEFNALADPETASIVAQAGIALDVT